MAKNPFRFGEKLLRAEVVDRQEEIGQIVQTIEDGKKLFLIGPRRHGKTVILHAAEEMAQAKNWHVFYFNAEAVANLGELSQRIFSAVTARLIKPTQKLKQSARTLLQRILRCGKDRRRPRACPVEVHVRGYNGRDLLLDATALSHWYLHKFPCSVGAQCL